MSRLSVFREDSIMGGMYKSSLTSLGFVPGYIPSSKEIDEAYAKRGEFLANTTILDQLYETLHKPVYRYERVYERIQYQYLLKQYDILYKYYYLLEKEGITKDSEKLLKSYEDEYEKCLTDIRHIETESNIVAELITSDIDDNALDSFISGLEKRDIPNKIDIDNELLSIKIAELKKKIKDLYSQQSSKSRIDIKKDYITRIKTLNGIMEKFPGSTLRLTNYLSEQSKVIVFDDVDLKDRREHLKDVTFISDFLTHPINGNPNISKLQLISKLEGIKAKFDYLLKLKRIDYIKLFKKKILTINTDYYLSNLTNFEIALSKLDGKKALFSTYTSIIGSIIDSRQLSSEDIAYLDGLLNSFNGYLDQIKVNRDQTNDVDGTLAKEQTELSSFCSFKEKAISENIIYRYVNLRNQIISYYDQTFIPVSNRKNIYKMLSSYSKLIKDTTTSLKDKLDAINYLADFANIYCSDNTLQKSRPLA